MKKFFIILALTIISLSLITSCSNQSPEVGSSPSTKKQMSQSEYASNSKAITALSVVEVYGMDVEKPKSKAITGAEEFRFDKDVTINTASLKEKSFENPILKQMVDNLPNNFEVTIKSGSYFTYTISESGIFTYHTVDIKISIDGKTIEIEKDYDDKWIEIDGTFFDSTPIEEMLDLAEDAADIIEDLFENFSWASIQVGEKDNIELEIRDKDKLEAKITGSIQVTADTGRFAIIFKLNCIEYEDDEKTIEKEYTLDVSLNFNYNISNFNELTKLEDLIKSLSDSITIKVNGKEVWKEAFLAELD